VKAGKMSKEDAEKKLIAVRKEMFRNPGEKKARGEKKFDREMEGKKRRYMAAAEQFKAAVEAGEVTKEDAEKRLIEMRKAMFGGGDKNGKADDRDMELKKRRYMAFSREIEAAVKAGLLSKEDAEKKLISVRTEIEMEAKKQRYMKFEREIEAAVKAGKVSKEDAEKRLIELRKKMFGDRD
jgi:uncharacterized protein YlaN (UPF0358 family)